MAKVSTRTPPLISLYFCQERGDPDYGSCLWAVFNFDLERYELSITSDCGNYAYGWVPTHKSEYYVSAENKSRIWTVASEPWMCCGTLVVKLEGKSGGYAVDGLDIISE